MRPVRLILAGLLLSTVAVTTEAGAQAKIGYIDSQAILRETPGAQEAQEQFERDMARFRAQVDEMGKELQNLITQYEQQQVTLSPEAKRTREQTIRQKQGEYQQKTNELEGQAGQRQAELVQPIMNRVMAAIDSIRQEGGYALIFDLTSQAIVSADPTLDLTQQVIQRLKDQAGEAAGGAPGR